MLSRLNSRLARWPRWLAVRRLVALVLVLLAAVLALRPARREADSTVPMLVAAHDLPPGTTLRAGDVEVSRLPPSLRPPAALTTPTQVTGHDAVWFGSPHLIEWVDRRGESHSEPPRLAAPTLVWVVPSARGEVTYRLEGPSTLTEALRVAESAR